MIRRPPRSTRTDTLFPYTTLFRSYLHTVERSSAHDIGPDVRVPRLWLQQHECARQHAGGVRVLRDLYVVPEVVDVLQRVLLDKLEDHVMRHTFQLMRQQRDRKSVE